MLKDPSIRCVSQSQMASHHPIPDNHTTPNSDKSEAGWLNGKEGDLSMIEANW